MKFWQGQQGRKTKKEGEWERDGGTKFIVHQAVNDVAIENKTRNNEFFWPCRRPEERCQRTRRVVYQPQHAQGGRGEIERQWGRGKGSELNRIKVNSNEAAADRCSLVLPVLATMANFNAAVSRQSRCLCPYPCLCPYHYSCSYSSCCLSFALLGQQWASKLKENTTKFHKLQLMFNELRWCLCQGAYAPLPFPFSFSPHFSLCFSFVKTLSDSCHKQCELHSDSKLSVSIFEIQSRPINPLRLEACVSPFPLHSA